MIFDFNGKEKQCPMRLPDLKNCCDRNAIWLQKIRWSIYQSNRMFEWLMEGMVAITIGAYIGLFAFVKGESKKKNRS